MITVDAKKVGMRVIATVKVGIGIGQGGFFSYAARLSLRRAAYSRPHIISLVLQAGTTATIFMSSGLTITTSSS